MDAVLALFSFIFTDNHSVYMIGIVVALYIIIDLLKKASEKYLQVSNRVDHLETRHDRQDARMDIIEQKIDTLGEQSAAIMGLLKMGKYKS